MKPSAPLSLGAASEPPRSVSRRTASARRELRGRAKGVHPAKLRAGQAPVGAARGVAGIRVPEAGAATGVARGCRRRRLDARGSHELRRARSFANPGAPAARTTPRARRRRRDARERPARRARARAPSARRAASTASWRFSGSSCQDARSALSRGSSTQTGHRAIAATVAGSGRRSAVSRRLARRSGVLLAGVPSRVCQPSIDNKSLRN